MPTSPRPSPDEARPKPDEATLHKVRSLLAKAEATTFPNEAEAFTAKAHELMAKHAIEHALLEGGDRAGDPTVLLLTMDNPYSRGKFTVLSAVARSNRCEAVLSMGGADDKTATIVGFPQDLEIVELLYTSLLLQATKAMMARGSVVDETGRNRTRSFRNAFFFGFARVIDTRFQANRLRAERDAALTYGQSALPVLVERADRVEAKLTQLFPHTERIGASISNGAGLAAGEQAGHSADLGHAGVGGGGAAEWPSLA